MSRAMLTSVSVLLAMGLVQARLAHGFQGCAVSPDGKTVVVGGDNRVLYVVDASTWKVDKRIWFGPRIKDICFGKDGTQCYVKGDDRMLHVLSTSDWTEQKRLKDMEPLALAADMSVALSVGRKRGGGWRDRALIVWRLPDWTLAKEIDLPKDLHPHKLALTADGKTAYVRTGSIKDPKEKDTEVGPEPKAWKARSLWKQRKDGRVTDVLVIDVGTGKISKTIRCFDSSMNYRIYPTADGAVFADYSQYCGVLDAGAGAYEVKRTDGFAYGSGRGPKGNLYTGGLASYLVLGPKAEKIGEGKIKKIPGFPEYFRRFTPLGADRVLGVTDAYRVIVIDASSHKVVKEVAVY
jgi:WD40 repeat protein